MLTAPAYSRELGPLFCGAAHLRPPSRRSGELWRATFADVSAGQPKPRRRMVEAVGVEPTSEDVARGASTGLVGLLERFALGYAGRQARPLAIPKVSHPKPSGGGGRASSLDDVLGANASSLR